MREFERLHARSLTCADMSAGGVLTAVVLQATPIFSARRSVSFRSSRFGPKLAGWEMRDCGERPMAGLNGGASYTGCGCGAPSITLPSILSDESSVKCGGCDAVVGTWLGYKTFVSCAIRQEVGDNSRRSPLICVDPITASSVESLLLEV